MHEVTLRRGGARLVVCGTRYGIVSNVPESEKLSSEPQVAYE